MKITKQELLEGLANLDPRSDAHWNDDGSPSLEAVRSATLDEEVTREDLAREAPDFDRERAAEALKARDASDRATDKALKDAASLSRATPDASPSADEASDQERRRAELQGRLDAAKRVLAEHDDAVAQARQRRQTLEASLNEAIVALEREFPPMRQAHATQDWIASEARKRAERAAATILVPAGRSPLDHSMQRRTGYGHGRKQVPRVAGT